MSSNSVQRLGMSDIQRNGELQR